MAAPGGDGLLRPAAARHPVASGPPRALAPCSLTPHHANTFPRCGAAPGRPVCSVTARFSAARCRCPVSPRPPQPSLALAGGAGWLRAVSDGGRPRPSCRHGRCRGAGTPPAVTFARAAGRTARRRPRGEAGSLGTCPRPPAPSPATFRRPPRSRPLPLLRLRAPARPGPARPGSARPAGSSPGRGR